MELQDIIIKYSNHLTKLEFFKLLHDLKHNLEMRADSFTTQKLFKLVGDVYGDNSPLYQADTTTNVFSEFLLTDNDYIIHSSKNKPVIETDKTITYYCIDSNSTLLELKENIEKIIDMSESRKDGIFYMFELEMDQISDIEINEIFNDMILPNNFILPNKYIYITYLSNYLFDRKKDTYYRINDLRTTVTVADFKTKKLSIIPYVQFINGLDYYNIRPISLDMYNHNVNDLIKKIHE